MVYKTQGLNDSIFINYTVGIIVGFRHYVRLFHQSLILDRNIEILPANFSFFSQLFHNLNKLSDQAMFFQT